MSTVAHAITTLAKVKAQLGIPTGTTTHDTLIESMINYVTDWIESYCGGRRFKSTTYTRELYDTKCNQSDIFLQQKNVTALSAVEYRSGDISTPTWTPYSANDYILYEKAGYIHFFARFSQSHRGLAVTYTAGFLIDFANELTSTHTLPFDITGAATDLVAQMFSKKDTQGIQSMQTEGQSITFADPSSFLNAAQKATLRKYSITHGV